MFSHRGILLQRRASDRFGELKHLGFIERTAPAANFRPVWCIEHGGWLTGKPDLDPRFE